MNKTIYVRDEDVPIWDKAKELAGDKLAPVIMDGLRTFVAAKERELSGFERIEIQFRDSNANNLPTAKAFVGRWIFSRDRPLCLVRHDSIGDSYSDYFAVAQTAKNRFAMLSWMEYQGSESSYRFRVFDDIDQLRSAGLHDVAAEVLEKIGVEVEELDI